MFNFLFINYSITANLLIVKSESYNSVSNRADFSSDVIYQIITDRFSDGDESNNPKGEIISSGIICIGLIGSPLPMWLFQETYMQSIIEMGMNPGYVNKMQTLISIPTLIGVIVTAFMGGAIGAYIGKSIFKKRFEKAGII